jgi:hypothetical protein
MRVVPFFSDAAFAVQSVEGKAASSFSAGVA